MNNKEENLQVLCPNCHSLTETYKSHNKEGRIGRKNIINSMALWWNGRHEDLKSLGQ